MQGPNDVVAISDNEAYKPHPSLSPRPCPYRHRPVVRYNLVHPWEMLKERRQNARMLRERALGNPSWRRRSWLVIIRARRTRYLRTRGGRCPKWFVFKRKGARDRCSLPLTVDETNMVIDSWPSGADDSFQKVVMRVVDLPEEELFRSIVSYI